MANRWDIVDELTNRGVRLKVGGSIHDPTDPIGRLLFTVLSMIAEFEADLARARTREGLAVAKAKGRLRGKPPKLKPTQEWHLVKLWGGGEHTTLELAELFSVSRATVHRAIQQEALARLTRPPEAEPRTTSTRRAALSPPTIGAVTSNCRRVTSNLRRLWMKRPIRSRHMNV